MKKFFELSVTSRKSVKGDLFFSAVALSKSGSKLGQLDINLLKEEDNYGVFLKYTQSESSSPLDTISAVTLTGRDKDEIRKILEDTLASIKDFLSNSSSETNVHALTLMLMLSVCIDSETNSIIIPEVLGFNITNQLISSIIGDEWLGIEIKISSDIKGKIHSLADAKRKKEDDDNIEAMIAAFKNCF